MPVLLEIVTPEKKVYSETVDHVVIPAITGEMDILPGHIPVLAKIQPGELRTTKDGQNIALAVDKGFAHIQGDKVSVLTEAAIDVKEIDLAAVERAREEAERELTAARERKEDPAVLEELETRSRFALAQRLIKNRGR